MLLRFCLFLMALLAAGAAAAPRPARPAVGGAARLAADVAVSRQGDQWIADYRFARAAPAWAFVHSTVRNGDRTPWRPGSWVVETPGVRLERHGRFDLLVGARGNVPARVRIRFRPVQANLEGSYSPALLFTDGTVALFTEQFNVTPLPSVQAALRLPVDPDEVPLPAGPTRTHFRDAAGPLIVQGVRRPDFTATAARSYVLFGSPRVVETPGIATILDPGLPQWLSAQLATSTTQLIAHYAEVLGPRIGPKPMLMASWAGATPKLASMNGGVLPGLVLMAFEGAGIDNPDDAMRDHVRWFFAHEAAHFWLGETVAADAADHAWIMEGGADLLAVRAIASMQPGYDPRVRLNQSLKTCIARAANRPINRANVRGEHDAYYACGAMFGLIAEAASKDAAQPGDGFAAFWRRLIARNAADRVVSEAEWLGELTLRSGDRTIARDIARMTDQGVDDPATLLASLFQRAGVPHRRAQDGGVELL